MNASQFAVLVDRLKDLSPEDSFEFQRARTEIIGLKMLLEQACQRELADFLGAADAMIRSISVLDGKPFEQIRELICDLLDVVGESVAGLGGQSLHGLVGERAQPDHGTKPSPDPEEESARAGLGRSPLNLKGETPSGSYSGIRTMSELLLGQLLVESEKLTRAQLVAGLKHQKIENTLIGESLVELGYISPADVEEALERQIEMAQDKSCCEVSSCAAAMQEMRLGQILVRVCGVSEEDLNRAVQIQRATGKRLGEAVVELGVASWERVEKAMLLQATNRGDQGRGLDACGSPSFRLDD